MEDSILKNVKKLLGVGDDDATFDVDIITLINSAFGVLTDIGAGPAAGYAIEDDQATWAQFLPEPDPMTDAYLPMLSKVKTAVYLRVRLTFDPPSNPPLLTAMQETLRENEWRISENRESVDWADPDPTPTPEEVTP